LWLLEPLFAGPASDTCADDSKKRITHTPPSPAAKRGGANFDYWQQVSTVTPNRIGFSRAPLTLLKKAFPSFFIRKAQNTIATAAVVVVFQRSAEDQLKFARCPGRMCLAASIEN